MCARAGSSSTTIRRTTTPCESSTAFTNAGLSCRWVASESRYKRASGACRSLAGRRSTPRRPQKAASDFLPPVPRQPAPPRRPLHPRRRGGPTRRPTRRQRRWRSLESVGSSTNSRTPCCCSTPRPGCRRQLADLRTAILNGIAHALNLDAVRQLLRRLFSAACYQSADAPRVAGAVARPGSHRTVRTLVVYGSSGRRVMTPAAAL